MSVKSKKPVPREVKEGFDLLNYFYGFEKEGDPDQYLMKESFRQDMYRLIILQLHMAIEGILKEFIYQSLPQRKTFTAKQNKEYVQKLRSRTAIDLAARLGIINSSARDLLITLNVLRNECAHNWLLHSFTMKQFKRLIRRKYSVEFNGKSLLNPNTMKNDFMPIYTEIYLEFFAVKIGVGRYKRKYLNY